MALDERRRRGARQSGGPVGPEGSERGRWIWPGRSDGGQGEHDMEVGHRQELGLAGGEPIPGGRALTRRAVATAAGGHPRPPNFMRFPRRNISRSRPSSAEVRLYEVVGVKVLFHVVHSRICVSSGLPVVSGFSVDSHAPCEVRINLYPAAPIRLATMLHT